MAVVRTSGHILQQTQEQAFAKGVEKGLEVLVLVRGILTDGTAHYAYASIPANKYRAFKLAQSKGAVDVREYGEVLYHGDGLDPDAATVERMRQNFGASHTFEDELVMLMEDAMEASFVKADATGNA